ncbi:Chromatin modification-related protein YNG2 OS=Debaryomyces hansenii (strain ATCC 36239 / CBS 767 / JCM 1990 / NBRC 0083 / IGC 2968) GN=YNG2 PE=3 SV=1 [Rhizoctonia solani AG-1 IB]|uniref:Chromatin modification-related protein n=1 Tax=Thanatephorus cucumeris (strain AG1-IB / isolate 7/3/14) TaxID=1108050 RepID=A0A0B7G3L1_THACB|nr:Chromatin modification-related protein YNG2 OS=Debaryomyces hansenii (strain ATCC 36239 / CBS 767 / JCM 1990 / NBRC 0083 / IGC 2968) GN=YNG2 PE=3 SV=1 [Rhizoctonia solani AG-1 IB]
MEEAANIASECVYSLDNLPSEVAFLLNEIKVKDQKCQEIQERNKGRMAKAFAHRTGSLSAANPANANPGQKDPFMVGSQAQLQQKIRVDQERIEKLSAQKVVLAQRLQQLVMKAAGRVDADLTRVRIASGELPAPQPTIPEPPSELPPFTIPPTLQIPAASPATIATALPVAVAKPLEPRGAPAPPPTIDALAANPSNPQLQQNKRRRTTTGVSTPIASSPSSTVVIPGVLPTTRHVLDEQGDEAEAGEPGATDDALYCFCNEKSYGEMIGCDNGNCAIQWFHMDCVGLKPPVPPDMKWYCSRCKENREDSDVQVAGISPQVVSNKPARKKGRRA